MAKQEQSQLLEGAEWKKVGTEMKLMRPWTDKDKIPVLAWVREAQSKNPDSITCIICGFGRYGFITSVGNIAFDGAFVKLEYSTDQGTTWLPCGEEITKVG